MEAAAYQQIRDSLRQFYPDDLRPWLVGYSGGKDSTTAALAPDGYSKQCAHGSVASRNKQTPAP